MTRFIAIEVEGGKAQVHAESSIAGYMTLCGLDGGLTDDTQKQVGLQIGARINCPHCRNLWSEAKRFKKPDFDWSQQELERQ